MSERTRDGGHKPEPGDDGKSNYTVSQVAADFGVTRTAIYRHLDR